MTIPARRPRSGAIDAVRLVGIVAIVAGHVWATGPLRDLLFTWHVPIFFFLTGYLWTTGRSLHHELLKRARTLLVPYGAWLAIISVPFVGALLLSGQFGLTVVKQLLYGGSYIGGPFAAFWFVTALYVATLAFRMLELAPMWAQWTIVALILAWVYLADPPLHLIPWSAGVAVPCMVFIFAGKQFRAMRNRISKPVMTAMFSIAGGASVILIGKPAPLDLKQGDFGTPALSVLLAISMCVGLILLAEAIVPAAGAQANRTITWLASAGFMVILTHAFFITSMHSLAPHGSWIIFVVALTVPWCAALILLRTPLAPVLIGVPSWMAPDFKPVTRGIGGTAVPQELSQ